VAGIDAASHALGHADLSTTLAAYGHWDASDLENAMRLYGDVLHREGRIVPPRRGALKMALQGQKVETAGIEPASAVA
jgi:hypothetical protein